MFCCLEWTEAHWHYHSEAGKHSWRRRRQHTATKFRYILVCYFAAHTRDPTDPSPLLWSQLVSSFPTSPLASKPKSLNLCTSTLTSDKLSYFIENCKMFREMRAPWLARTSSSYFHKARALRHSALLRYNAHSLRHRYERTQFTINFMKEIKKLVPRAFGSCLSALLSWSKKSSVLI